MGKIKKPTKPAQPIIAVVGPTASGKSDLALEIAKHFGGEVLSTDSMQVYQYLDIGTAKPDAAMQREVPHHLIDVVKPDGVYSAGAFVSDAGKKLTQLKEQGKLPVFCGGSGLYFRALFSGMADIPPVPEEIQAGVRALLEAKGVSAVREELKKVDPAGAAKLNPNDSQRNMRALEVWQATGKPLAHFQETQPFKQVGSHVWMVGFGWERSALYERINKRVQVMLDAGWAEEVKGILDRGYDPNIKPLQGIGYREIVELVQGKRNLTGLAEAIAQRTRQYAKRQLTWFRNQGAYSWFSPKAEKEVIEKVEIFLQTGQNPIEQS